MSLDKINGILLKKMIIAGANELNKNKQLVDSLNVFPVPDGDTGTNMSLTALAAAREAEKSTSLSVSEVAKLISDGSLRGARGNSGVILSQLFRGFAKGLDNVQEATTLELANALNKAVKIAYKAVMKPKEGTILTVAKACAEKAAILVEIDEQTDIELFLGEIIEAANETLLQTKEMLPVLKQADVVDAGGKGLLCILEGAYRNIHTQEELTVDEPNKVSKTDYSALASIENESITFGYCTEFFINRQNTDDSTMASLKAYLGSIGDSIVAVNNDDVIKIHVHTDHPGLAIEKALTLGSLSGLKIDNMRQQHTNRIDFSESEKQPEQNPSQIEEKQTGFVCISMGEGLSEIFKNLGVDIVVEGGQTMNPSTEDILNAIEHVPAKNVVVLPNNKNIVLAAQQAAKLSKDKQVFVLPTKTIPEGITAMFNYDNRYQIEQAVEDMKDSFADIQTCMVTYAVRDTSLEEKEIKQGDILGMLNGEIAVVEKQVNKAAKELLDLAVSENNDMISLYYGNEVTQDDAEELANYLEEKYPDCEIEIQYGGQPLYYYIISVE